MKDIKIVFNKDEKRSEAYDGDKQIGMCEYREDGENINIYHTEVDPNYGGMGLAGKLLDEVVDAARNENIKIIPTCSYAVKKFDEGPKYEDVDAR